MKLQQLSTNIRQSKHVQRDMFWSPGKYFDLSLENIYEDRVWQKVTRFPPFKLPTLTW